ncbi:hypothetical protein B0H16DRAFT_1735868 [Mycena metata]|uniref:Transcription regulator Rua1 C-terminal domain-containing protein n=1 Tax=Mycena metata TaxID=1033252 RepID=A0AAD7HRY6_9AGAR|nr:hypothetical protein B0H16DRAFT_1735868 [Mycena metata]
MSNLENVPVPGAILKPESPAWNPSILFFSNSDLMDVDSPCAWRTVKPAPDYTMESQYSHIQSPDFLPLAPSSASTSSTTLQPSTFGPHSPFRFRTAHSQSIAPFVDTIMRTPADFSIPSLPSKDAVTPFGKNFQLSDDWIVSGSYISPVIHTQRTKQSPLKFFSSPSMSFMDRLQHSSPSPYGTASPLYAKNTARRPPPLLSPCKLTAPRRTSAKKENLSDPFSLRRRPFQALVIASPTNSLLPISPLSPLTPSPNKPVSLKGSVSPAAPVAKRKKRRLSVTEFSESPTTRVKRTRYNLRALDGSVAAPSRPLFSTRTLPSGLVVSPNFPLFYRCFPVSSYFHTPGSKSPCALFGVRHPGGQYKAPRHALDLYSPRFVKGSGADRMGLCPICIEAVHRGGEGKQVWLATESSAYQCHHMQHYHGISAITGRPLSPPVDLRVVARPAAKRPNRAEMQQGKCHKCHRWVAIQTTKDVDVKVPELIWWKHAVSCHGHSVLEGEGNVFEEDDVYEVLKGLEAHAN